MTWSCLSVFHIFSLHWIACVTLCVCPIWITNNFASLWPLDQTKSTGTSPNEQGWKHQDYLLGRRKSSTSKTHTYRDQVKSLCRCSSSGTWTTCRPLTGWSIVSCPTRLWSRWPMLTMRRARCSSSRTLERPAMARFFMKEIENLNHSPEDL